jgi:hypothetical protein
MTAILIGNGINLTSENNDILSNVNINRRIMDLAKFAMTSFSYLDNPIFIKRRTEMIDLMESNLSIEELFEYWIDNTVKENLNGFFDTDYDLRLISTINTFKRLFVNAIFTINGDFIEHSIPDDISSKLSRYDSVFTTNYYEYWQDSKEVIYLHGKIEYVNYEHKPVNGIDNFHNIDYISNQEDQNTLNLYFPIKNIGDIIMLPLKSKYNKNIMYLLSKAEKAKYDGDRIEEIKKDNIYSELSSLESLDIYGFSPYGDELIMKSLKKIKRLRVYVYELESPNGRIEAQKWQSYLPNVILLDSSKF